MLAIMPQRNQWAGCKVYLNLYCISLQSVAMVVSQTMVNTLACTNQAIFHLLVLQAVDSSFWHGTVYSHVKVLRGCVEVYSTVYMQMHDGEIAQEFKGALFP